MSPAVYPAAVVLDGWRAPALTLSEAGLTLPADTPLARLLLGQPHGVTHTAELEVRVGGALLRYPVRFRCTRGKGAAAELAFTALPPELRARLRTLAPDALPLMPTPAPGSGVRLAAADQTTPRSATQLPGGRRLVLASSAAVWRQTRRRRGEILAPPAPAVASPPVSVAPPVVEPAPVPARRSAEVAYSTEVMYFVLGSLLLVLAALAALWLLL